MSTMAPSESGGNTAKTVAKWAAVVTIALCVLQVGLYLADPATGDRMGLRIVAPVGFLVMVGGLFVATTSVRLVLAVCGAVTVMAAVVLDILGY